MKNLKLKNKSYQELELNFKEWLDILGYSEQIIYQLPNHIREFLYYLEQEKVVQIKQLTTEHIYDYYHKLRSRKNYKYGGGLSAAYINKHREAIHRFMDYLRQMGNHQLPYFEQKSEAVESQTRTVLTIAEVKHLFEVIDQSAKEPKPKMTVEFQQAIGQRDKAMLCVFYHCGLRRNEGNNLKVSDLDLDQKLLHVKKGKGYKERKVPFTQNTGRAFSDYLSEGRKELLKSKKSHYFFISKYGNHLHDGGLHLRLKELQKASEMSSLQDKKVSLHNLRHSIATHLLSGGMKIEQISRFLGHSSLNSTQIYTHLTMSGDN
ncbi:MAG: tyrosine-type recombinase/integrase [Flavobacteriales bacterium]|nr:tyrosine-type recombinase/integrase [Flavobacteriales bacterium]